MCLAIRNLYPGIIHSRSARLLLAALGLIAFSVQAGQAQTHPGVFVASHCEPLMPRQLATFEVVLGRLQLSSESFRIGSAHERILLDSKNGEEAAYRVRSIAVSVARGRPTLQFQDVGGAEYWKLQFKAGHHAEIRFAPHDDRLFTSWSYHQPAKGQIAVEVQFNDKSPRRVESTSLWHLMLADPEFFNVYVEPVLTRLEPSWDFQRTGEEVQQLMSEQARQQTPQSVTAGTLASAISQLDSNSVATRTAACLEIERRGLAAKAQLQSALSGPMSNQQRSAVNRLLDELQPTGNDSAMRVAVWLGGDREVRLASHRDAGALR